MTEPEQIFVVSDIHLGGTGSNPREFSDFLRWIRDLPDKDPPLEIECTRCEKNHQFTNTISLRRPTKLVLLGDTLELWDPRNQNRNNVIRDAIEPLSCLHELPGEIVYVTGNHDEDIRDLAAMVNGSFSWHNKRENECKRTSESNVFIVHNHYPDSKLQPVTTPEGMTRIQKVMPGLPVDGIRCSFVHGHQFDLEQIQYLIGKVFNARFDPVDLISDLSNVTLVQQLKEWSIIISIAWIFSIFMVSGIPDPWIITGGSIALSLVPFILLVNRRHDAKKVISNNNVRGWRRYLIKWMFLWSLPTVIGLFILAWYSDLFTLVTTRVLPIAELVILTYLFITVPFVQSVAAVKRGVYQSFVGIRDRHPDKALEAGFNPARDTFDCDVVVFGHTHRAGWAIFPAAKRNPEMGEQKPLLFLNTGCWVKEGNDPEIYTFVAINGEGASLMQWVGCGKVRGLRHFSLEEMKTQRILKT